MTTFKIPQPDMFFDNGSEAYSEKLVQQALRDVLEQAAKEFEHMGGFKDGYSCAASLRAMIKKIPE